MMNQIQAQIAECFPADARMRADAMTVIETAMREPAMVDSVPSYAPEFTEENYPGFSTDQVDAMARLQIGNFYWEGRSQLIAWAIRRFFPNATRVLDIGCGTGYVTETIAATLPNAFVYGSDVFTSSIRYARRRLNDRAFLMHLDAENLPFKNCFDLITSFDVLEHIERDEIALQRMLESLRKGGGMLHIVPQHPWLWCPADTAAGHQRRYRVGELRRKIESLGMKIVLDTSMMSLLLPAMTLSRVSSRLRNSYSFDQEYRISPLLNKLMGQVLRMEVASIRAGMRWPLGGSRVIVALAQN